MTVDGDTVSIGNAMAIDLGSVAKGYACDRMRAVLTEGGASSGLIDFGGNICALGLTPILDSSA